MDKNQLEIIETVLTDSNERILDNRMLTEEMLPVLESLDHVGYYAIECFAGPIFESAFITLDDPWKRLAEIRSRVKNTKLLLTMQGARIFSEQLYPDRMVDAFVEVCAENGISAFRFYDRDNDLTNLRVAVSSAKRAGAEVQAALVYGPEVSCEELSDKAKEAVSMGADIVFIRDTDGILSPYKAAVVFDKLSASVPVMLGLEMHQNKGFAEMSYLKAAEHGCRILDTAISSFYGTVGHPATEVIAKTFEGSVTPVRLCGTALQEIDAYMRKLSEDYQNRGIFGTDKLTLDPGNVPGAVYQDSGSLLYDDLTEDDIRHIRTEIALVEKDPLDVVTYALYPEQAKDYLTRRSFI